MINYQWKNFRNMDICFTHHTGAYARIIRWACAGWKARRDKSVPNHAMFVLTVGKQVFAGEATARGLRITPMEKYRVKKNRIIRVFRWRGFDDKVLRAKAGKALARQIRLNVEKKIGYDWLGAISSPWAKWHKKADDPNENFCSENVIEELVRWGYHYTGKYQHPPALLVYMEAHPSDFLEVTGKIL